MKRDRTYTRPDVAVAAECACAGIKTQKLPQRQHGHLVPCARASARAKTSDHDGSRNFGGAKYRRLSAPRSGAAVSKAGSPVSALVGLLGKAAVAEEKNDRNPAPPGVMQKAGHPRLAPGAANVRINTTSSAVLTPEPRSTGRAILCLCFFFVHALRPWCCVSTKQ